MIGVFDSGLGGLSTLLALRKLCPEADIVYLADQAHAPYGERSPKELCSYLRFGIDFFQRQGAEAMLLACGTLSAVALPQLENPPPFPLFGVIEGATAKAKEKTKSGVAVLATSASIRSKVYQSRLLDMGVRHIEAVACPLLVPLLEEGFLWDSPATKEVLAHYLAPLKASGCDTVLLGCTHYGFLAPLFQALWPKAQLVPCGEVLAEYTLSHFVPRKGQGKTLLYTTGAPNEFLKKTSALHFAPPTVVLRA